MGSLRFAALAVLLLLALALVPPHPAAAARVLEGEKPRSSEGAPAPTAGKGGTDKSSISKESENPVTDKQHQKTPPPKTTQTQTPPPPETTQTPPPQETTQTPKDSPPPKSGAVEDKKPGGDGAQVAAQPVPSRKESPPPGGQESKKPDEPEEVAAKCKDPVDTCSIDGKLSACLQISKTASIGQFLIVKNTGKNTITVDVKATSDISVDQTLLSLNKGESKRVSISYSNPNGGEITLNVGTEPCVLQIGQQPVYDWQQQFQQLAVYATSMKPIYGAYFFVFTLVLVGAVCACCKFAGKKRDEGVQYQQLEMGSHAPDSSGANNTTNTVDGWDEGWDDDDWDDEEAPAISSEKGSSGSGSANGLSLPARSSEKGSAGSGSSNGLSLRPQTSSKDGWDDEEAPAKSSEKGSAGSGSANGLSLRPQTNSTDGWDVDWDD